MHLQCHDSYQANYCPTYQVYNWAPDLEQKIGFDEKSKIHMAIKQQFSFCCDICLESLFFSLFKAGWRTDGSALGDYIE